MKKMCLVLPVSGLICAALIWFFACGRNKMDFKHSNLKLKGLKGVVEESVDRWITLPYTNAPLKTFMYKLGKSFYEHELAYSERGMICPFGAVSRNIKKELGIYSINVRIPLTASARQVYESNASLVKPVYVNRGTNTVAVLLTLSKDWKSLGVAELRDEAVDQNLFRSLDELECVVVFDGDFICLRNRGEELFRGYKLLPNSEMRDAKSAK